MKKYKFYILFFVFLIFLYYLHNKEIQNIKEEFSNYYLKNKIERSKEFQQYIYQNFPIFEDWNTGDKILQLRQFLYPEHIKIAKDLNLPIIKDQKDISPYYSSIDTPEMKTYYFFYNVPKELRYFYKDFIPTLLLIGERFNEKINFQDKNIITKLCISSALRPENYQKNLQQKNQNAIDNSTHSYGISIDIFYDEFYINFEFICNNLNHDIQKICKKDINQQGYFLGGNLRRQLTSILAETLIELQNEKKILVIWEKNQRIFHITPTTK